MEQGYEFKVIVTNKTTAAGKVARFHEDRGYQEKLYGELKGQAQMGYVPARRLAQIPKLGCKIEGFMRHFHLANRISEKLV